jgi:hypothetical protein
MIQSNWPWSSNYPFSLLYQHDLVNSVLSLYFLLERARKTESKMNSLEELSHQRNTTPYIITFPDNPLSANLASYAPPYQQGVIRSYSPVVHRLRPSA